ncbi:MAG: hypothetical protein R3A52_28950 [Polyangiales bacterium]
MGAVSFEGMDEDGNRARRAASAVALESALVCPAVLDSPEAEALGELLEEVPAVIFREMRAQWAAGGKLDGAALLELARDARQQEWIAARLAVIADAPEVQKRCLESLNAAARALHKARANEYARFLKHQSARAGVQGDPATEQSLLNEQLSVKRQIALGEGPKGRD